MKKVTSILLLLLLSWVTYSQVTITIGTQVVQSGTSGIGPTNYYWESRRIQWVMTASEILAAGGYAGNIISIAYDQSQLAGGNLLNYQIKLGHTTATNAASHNTAPLTLVYSTSAFTPGNLGWRTIVFDTPFAWDGVNNILFDVCWGVNAGWSSTGQVWLYNNVANQMRGVFSSSANVCNSTTTATRSGKPRMQITFAPAGGVAPPGNFTATAMSENQIDLAWTLNEKNHPVMIAFNLTPTFGDPVNGTSYPVGSSLPGGGTVIYSAAGTSFAHTGLNPNTMYYYKAWSIGDNIEYSTGVTASAKTFCATYDIPFSEYFPTAAFPECWSQTFSGGVTSPRWNVNNSNLAGGTPYEMRAVWTSGIGISRLITPKLNTTGIQNLILSFKTYIDDYGPGATFKVQSSSDGINWNNVPGWSYTTVGNVNVGPLDVVLNINQDLGGITYLAWVIEGDHYQFDYWYVDNVVAVAPVEVNGVVTSSLSGNPIPGASVKFGTYPPVFTQSDGSYQAWVLAGTYDVTCSATGYNTKVVQGFVVNQPGPNVLNIALDNPTMEISPSAFQEFLLWQQTSSNQLTITNNGNGELNWTAKFVNPTNKSTTEKTFYKNVPEVAAESSELPNNHHPSKGIILWNNTNINLTTSGIVSTHLGGLGPDGKTITADDFVVPVNEIWYVDYVYTQGFGSVTTLPDAFVVEFFADNNNKPGDLLHSETVIPSNLNLNTQELTLAAPVMFTPGRYWVSVYAYYATATALSQGRWNWYRGTVLVENEAALRDYGSIFNLPPTVWYYLSEIGVANPSCYFLIMGEKTSWVSLSVMSGTVPAGSKASQAIDIIFNAGAVNPGSYSANLVFSSLEGIPSVTVPVSLTVSGPVQGIVTSSLTGLPVPGAIVTIGSYPPVTTLPDGSYQAWAAPGVYNVTCTAPGFNPLFIGNVPISGPWPFILNIALDSPTMEISPSAVEDVVYWNQTSSKPLTITNNGTGTLNWVASFANPVSWASLSATSGTILPGNKGSQTIQVNFNAGAVSPGWYSTQIIFSSLEGIPPVTIPVTLCADCQSIPLPDPNVNSWGYLSTNLNLTSKVPLETLLADILDEMIIMIGNDGIFWPSQNINTIGHWNVYRGYKLKMGLPASLAFVGEPLSNKTVVFPAGTFLIPVLSEGPISAAALFGGANANKIDFAFGLDGTIWWPFGGIYTLQQLVPGYGYLVRFNAQTTLNFNLKDQGNPNVIPQFVNNTPWNDVYVTGDVHVIGIAPEVTKKLNEGDIIGVFNSHNLCTGMVMISNTGEPVAFMVFGDDLTTEAIDGMKVNEYMNFRLFRNGTITELTPVYSTEVSDSNGVFNVNGLSMIVEFKGATGISGAETSAIRIYPNPSSGIFHISGLNTTSEVVVTNMHGQTIFTTTMTSGKLDLTGQPSGVYFIRITTGDQTISHKVVIR